MAKLPKSIIKKYGITKKAWQVFRGAKRSLSRTVKRRSRNKTEVKPMARRRYSGFKKRRSSRASSGGKFKPLMDAAVGGAIAGAALKLAPAQFNTPMYRIGAGGAAAYFGNGYVREAGKVLLALEVARMTNSAMNGGIGALTSQSAGNVFN